MKTNTTIWVQTSKDMYIYKPRLLSHSSFLAIMHISLAGRHKTETPLGILCRKSYYRKNVHLSVEYMALVAWPASLSLEATFAVDENIKNA